MTTLKPVSLEAVEAINLAASYGVAVALSADDASSLHLTGAMVSQDVIKRLTPYKPVILELLRMKAIEAHIKSWQDWCTDYRGYDWGEGNWLIDAAYQKVLGAAESYSLGEIKLGDVHRVFVAYAGLHRSRFTATIDGDSHISPIPQAGYWSGEDAPDKLRMFGITVEAGAKAYLDRREIT